MTAPNKDSLLYLPIMSNSVVKVHPMVLFGIMDHFSRRTELSQRVVGALLGTVSMEGVVEVKNYFPIPHTDKPDQIDLDVEHFQTMLNLCRQVNSREGIVGWFGTGKEVDVNDFHLNDFFSQQTSNPIFVIVDANLQGSTAINVRAYVAKPQLLDAQIMWGLCFARVPCELKTFEAERITLDFITKSIIQGPRRVAAQAGLMSDVQAVRNSIKSLITLLDEAVEVVESVQSGSRPADPAVGRGISDAIGSVPSMSEKDFRSMFDDAVEDVLMVSYLASLVKAQIALSQKLNTTHAQ